jgi:cytoskeletal protein CcmA (bactofilin family)
MWKRENEPAAPAAAPTPPPAAPRREREPEPAVAATARVAESGGRAVIGASIVVRGEISGEEDLLVEGRVEGKIDLRGNAVTVGAKGQVVAEVHARLLLIDGEVEGNLTAEEQIVLRKSGRVKGDMTSPRVTIEDGARFKGSIDMEPKSVRPAASTHGQPARPTAVARPTDALAASLAAVASSS